MPESIDLLIVAPLTVSSSYGQNVEEPAGESFDTVQFFLPDGGDAVYRVRTFALDHDIHVHQIGWPADSAHDRARTHLDDAYGQVLASGRRGMREVVYLGGIARFWLPESWQIEIGADQAGCFYGPAGSGTLRLSVLTVDTAAPASGPPPVRHSLKAGERPIDGGRLPSGDEFDVYEKDDHTEGTRLRFWQIVQVLPGQCRIYLFSYAFPIDDAGTLAGELAMVDNEVRRMIPYPERL